MSLTGSSSLSLRKSDLTSDKSSGTYRKVQFAHKASGSETGINLASLTTPSAEMPGFVQPSQAELSACQILFNQKNLVLTSSLRGVLVPYMSYVVASSTQINFTDSFGAALPGEIFVGTIDGTSRDGVSPAATSQIVVTGTLAANTTDFNVGTPFITNANPGTQLGAVLVYLDGQLMLRNVSNATAGVSADGNYQEVDSGSGYSSVVRFNQVDPSNARVVMVVSNGSLVEQPSGSIKATVETLAGQQDLVIQTLANVAGVPTSNFYAAPNNVDMLSFGNKVLTIEQNAAYKNVSNAWTANQQFLGKTDGAAVAAGYVGERRNFTQAIISAVTTGFTGLATPLDTLPAGCWLINFMVGATGAASATLAEGGIATNSNNDTTGILLIDATNAAIATINTNGVTSGNYYAGGPGLILNISSSQAIYGKAITYGANRNVIIRGFAVRIA